MSEPVPSIMAQSWPWASQIAVTKKTNPSISSKSFPSPIAPIFEKSYFPLMRGGGGGGGGRGGVRLCFLKGHINVHWSKWKEEEKIDGRK